MGLARSGCWGAWGMQTAGWLAGQACKHHSHSRCDLRQRVAWDGLGRGGLACKEVSGDRQQVSWDW